MGDWRIIGLSPCVHVVLQHVCKSPREQVCIMRFLKGLNDQFSSVGSQILLMYSLPSINQVYSIILQQERQFASENIDAFGLAARNSGVVGMVLTVAARNLLNGNM